MIIELALIAALAVGVGWILIGPFLRRRSGIQIDDPLPIEETRRGQALLAIKDLDFDYATGKIAADDYGQLRDRYVREAAAVIDVGDPDPVESFVAARRVLLGAASQVCHTCGPRPEEDARFCSTCGLPLSGAGACGQCGAPLVPGARYCEACGARAEVISSPA